MPRIASLLASGTEIAAALGAAGDLIGVSHECDYPSSIRALPVLTKAKVNPHLPSNEIHRDVQTVMLTALSLYDVDSEKLEALKPDVIITQEQCKVCAVSLDDVRQTISKLVRQQVDIVSLNPTCLDEIFQDVRRVAEALGKSKDGEQLVASMHARLDAVTASVKNLAAKPSVVFIEWIDPIFAGGNWMPELIARAGGVSLLGEAGAHSSVYTLQDLMEVNPDVIVIAPCGFKLKQTKKDLHLLTEKPEWKTLNAVKAGQVWLADGNEFFNRSGPRIVESATMLAAMLHPQHFERNLSGYVSSEMVERLEQ